MNDCSFIMLADFLQFCQEKCGNSVVTFVVPPSIKSYRNFDIVLCIYMLFVNLE